MLALNKTLIRAGEGVDIYFLRVKYLPSKAMSVFYTDKVNN